MKVFEKVKEPHKQVIKLFGKTLYRLDIGQEHRVQNMLGGSLVIYKRTHNEFHQERKFIKLFGINIYERVNDGYFKKEYFLNIQYSCKDKKLKFYNKYKKHFGKSYDDIYILHGTNGEICCFLAYLYESYKKNNGTKNPLLVATKNSHIGLIELFAPDMPIVFLKDLDTNMPCYAMEMENKRIYTVFPSGHYMEVERRLKNERGSNIKAVHYFDIMLEHLNIKRDELLLKSAKISTEIKKSTDKKIKNIGLNVDNFVFISPEANTCKNVSADFWIEIIKGLKEKGVDTFVNITNPKSKLLNYGKNCDLSLSEAYALSTKAKAIVSLRSGFTELLMQADKQMIVIYTDFPHRKLFPAADVDKVFSCFCIEKLPNFNERNIKSFKFDNISAKIVTENLEECMIKYSQKQMG